MLVGLCLGVFIGVLAGVFIMCLMVVASRNDEAAEGRDMDGIVGG
jgi:hypothetical protein